MLQGSRPGPKPRRWRTAAGVHRLGWVDQLVGSSAGGDIFTSTTGDDWQQVGAAVGEVTALDAGPGAWHLATEGGAFTSTDAGKSWTLLVEIA